MDQFRPFLRTCLTLLILSVGLKPASGMTIAGDKLGNGMTHPASVVPRPASGLPIEDIKQTSLFDFAPFRVILGELCMVHTETILCGWKLHVSFSEPFLFISMNISQYKSINISHDSTQVYLRGKGKELNQGCHTFFSVMGEEEVKRLTVRGRYTELCVARNKSHDVGSKDQMFEIMGSFYTPSKEFYKTTICVEHKFGSNWCGWRLVLLFSTKGMRNPKMTNGTLVELNEKFEEGTRIQFVNTDSFPSPPRRHCFPFQVYATTKPVLRHAFFRQTCHQQWVQASDASLGDDHYFNLEGSREDE